MNDQIRAFDGKQRAAAAVMHIKCVCEQAPISAQVIVPTGPVRKPPMLALHGISRKADEVTGSFLKDFMEQQRIVVIPHFDQANWPVFQRITARHRPDLGLLAILGALRQDGVIGNDPVDLFGYSGGAQLAHRFAMLFPEKVNELHLGAAGWYTLPDPRLPYPLGVGPGGRSRKNWHRLMASGMPRYLDRSITVYVGDKDTQQDGALRKDTLLNQVQGADRFERAKRYVAQIGQRQQDLGLPVTARLEVLADCSHDFLMCCRKGGMVRRIGSISERVTQF